MREREREGNGCAVLHKYGSEYILIACLATLSDYKRVYDYLGPSDPVGPHDRREGMIGVALQWLEG